MQLGYNTNGFAHHDPESVIELLAEIGYQAIGLTIDHGVLNPRATNLGDQAGRLRRLAKKRGLEIVVETGARYLLDPRVKHEPTLVSATAAQREKRIAFYAQAIDIAKEMRASCISIWSGVVHDMVTDEEAFDRLIAGLTQVLQIGAKNGIYIAFEPEPGMLVDTMASYAQLKERLKATGAPIEPFRLTLDLGHLHCQGETMIAEQIYSHADELVNVHIEDMKEGVHEHLPFGQGEMEFEPIIEALKNVGYAGPLCVELSRHSHMAPEMAQQAYDFLQPMIER